MNCHPMRTLYARTISSPRTVVLLAFAFLTVYFTGVFPPYANPNELSRLQAAVSMAEWRTFAIDRAVESLGAHEDTARSGGRLYSNKAPGLAFAGYPVYRLLRLVLPAPAHGTGDPIFYFLRLLTVSLASLIALGCLGGRLADFRRHPSAAPLVLLAVALGTPFLYYARSFFSHAWTASLLFLAWDLLRRGEEPLVRRPMSLAAGAGLLAGWAAISEYTVAPIALLLLARAAAPAGRRRFAAFALGAAVPVALLLFYDAVCFGSPWTLSSAREASPDYAALASGGAFGFGLPSLKIGLALLIGPARGVLAFSPFLLWFFAGLARWWRSGRNRVDCLFIAVSVPAYFVILTAYPNWHGGWSLGSRYLLPMLFFAALPIVLALESPLSRGFFLAATAFSVGNHFLLTATWTHFPKEIPWPAASGSAWFLARGWVAQNLGSLLGAGAMLSLLLPALATLAALAAASRTARPTRPAVAVALLLGVAPLAYLALRPPEPDYFGRLWRAGVLGAFSGRDDGRQELGAVVLDAKSPEEKRLAIGMWRWLGPRPPLTAR